MDFLFFLFVIFIIVSVVRSNAEKAKARQPPPPAFFDRSQVPAEHQLVLAEAPAAELPAGASSEESSSEQWRDELAGDRELDSTGATPAEMVSLEATEVAIPEPVTAGHGALSLEQEVDWEAEHTRFHRRYVDAGAAGRVPAHGLMEQMRDPAVLRRAVLMAEILGPPKSMRGRR